MVKFFFFLHMMCLSSTAFAMMSSASGTCPQKFVAKVEQIVEAPAPLGPRSTDKVILKLEEVIRGEVKDQEEIQVLTFSTIKLSKGESYILELREGKICSVVSVNEHHE
ncbi:MAG: hypothetical protein ACOYL6_09535 [Bacteriovoracaceae bacterium]